VGDVVGADAVALLVADGGSDALGDQLGVAVAEAVMDGTAPGVSDAVLERVGSGVTVPEGVLVAVPVGAAVPVPDGVSVAVSVGADVPERVSDGVRDALAVGVLVLLPVREPDALGVMLGLTDTEGATEHDAPGAWGSPNVGSDNSLCA
jgi:hypothetical protein